jgi:cytochrome c oxidase cbb3-type subunit III
MSGTPGHSKRASVRIAVTAGALGTLVLAGACERETRRYRELPVGATRAEGVPQIPLQPGEAKAEQHPALSPYQQNAYGISEGKRLFAAFNCVGCHANGGGGIGPPLMDDKWIYGSAPDQIYSSIVEGRPDGMPAYGGRIPDQQVWQIVAYVQALSGQVPRDAAPGRNDDMSVNKPEGRIERQPPRQTGHR